jgi:hypothetical protein
MMSLQHEESMVSRDKDWHLESWDVRESQEVQQQSHLEQGEERHSPCEGAPSVWVKGRAVEQSLTTLAVPQSGAASRCGGICKDSLRTNQIQMQRMQVTGG